MTQPYETPAFSRSAEFTVAITVVVAGGKRDFTADARSRRIFERLANHAARCKHALQVTATAGPSRKSEILWNSPVAFTGGNTSPDPLHEGKFYRYLDPEFEYAKRALVAANKAAQARRDADRRRRSAVGCANAYPLILELSPRSCECAYCEPEDHLLAARPPRDTTTHGLAFARCLCGTTVPGPGQRCGDHHGVALELLDGDPPPLQLLADYAAAG